MDFMSGTRPAFRRSNASPLDETTLAREEEKQRVNLNACCSKCKSPWGKDRQIKQNHKAPEFMPYSSDCLVAFQSEKNNMQDKLFQTLQFRRPSSWGPSPRLVTEFEYDTENGQVFYDPAAQELKQCCYARLITQNSWYITLCWSMVFVVLVAADTQSNLELCMKLLFDEHYICLGSFARWAFIGVWLGMLLITLILAVQAASAEWTLKSSALVGDIIEDHKVDTWISYCCLVMLRWLLIEMRVKDIVIMLHPVKAMQPFAAVKMDTARAFIVGYENEYAFRVQNQSMQEWLLPCQLFSKLSVVTMKLWIAYNLKDHRLVLAASSLSTFIAMVLLLVKLYQLCKDRSIYKASLVEDLREKICEHRKERHPEASVSPSAASDQGVPVSGELQSTDTQLATASVQQQPSQESVDALPSTASLQQQMSSWIAKTQCAKLLAQHYRVRLEEADGELTEVPVDMDRWIEDRIREIVGRDVCSKCSRNPEQQRHDKELNRASDTEGEDPEKRSDSKKPLLDSPRAGAAG